MIKVLIKSVNEIRVETKADCDELRKEVYAAAKLANADTFIKQLPDGYNTILTGDGANLSQGQRQLLAIARAFAADVEALLEKWK